MSQGSKTLLLIDDEATARAFICSTLGGAGYTVLEGESYDEGLDLHERHSKDIDLLLVDATLPTKNGFELARALRQRQPDLQVLFMSGDVGSQLCRYYGMAPTDVHFLKKPFLPIELIERVKCLLALPVRSFKSASS
jgi:DNA-binding response OmpR family regulator